MRHVLKSAPRAPQEPRRTTRRAVCKGRYCGERFFNAKTRSACTVGGCRCVREASCVVAARQPPLQPANGVDSAAALELATRAANGDWLLGPGLYYVSPLYVYFLSFLSKAGASPSTTQVIQLLLGAIAVGLVYGIAYIWSGRRAGIIAGGLVALCGVLTLHEIIIFQAAIDPVLTAAGLLALSLALRFDRWQWAAATGLILGLHTLNRPNVWFAIFAVAAVTTAIRRPRLVAALALGVFVALTPILIRNAVVANEWTVSSSHGGLNFFIGNNQTGHIRESNSE